MEQINKIIIKLCLNNSIKSSDFIDIPRVSFSRYMKILIEKGYCKKQGNGKNTNYIIGDKFYLAEIPYKEYFEIDQDKRIINKNKDFFDNISKSFSNNEYKELEKLKDIWKNKYNSSTDTIRRKEMQRITIELAWKSSKIEGNTYSLLDTERLILESKESINHTHNEAVMILNHKTSLDFILANRDYFKIINKKKIEEIHSLLVEGLYIDKGIRNNIVGITGTNYKPSDNKYHIEEELDIMINNINNKNNIIDKVFTVLIGIAYIQPFADGNKRTSRMLANALLLANNYPPISFRSIDEIDYKKAIILCYEKQNIFLFKKLFIEQFQKACTDYF